MSVKSWFDELQLWVKIVLIIALIIFYPVGIIFLIVYLVSWAINYKKKHSAIEVLENYVEQHNNIIDANKQVILQRDEELLYSQLSDFYEERAIRNYKRTGHSIRIMKGWWYHLGSGQAESHGELRKIDSGVLYVTNKRFIFKGTLKNYNYNRNKILTVQPFSDSIRIAVDGRQKTLTFTTATPILLGSSVQIFQENKSLEKEAQEYLENELKRKILEKIQLIEGNLSFNVKTYEELAHVFSLIFQAIEIDTNDYSQILHKIPKEITTFKGKVNAITEILENYEKELGKVKTRLGDSAKKDILQEEFDKVVDKKYGKDILVNSMNKFMDSMNSLGVGQIDLSVKNKKEN
jgi:hypothetical protein